MDVAARGGPPAPLPRSCLAAGRAPAPGRWRGAISRASLDSPSPLPLFNQIIGKSQFAAFSFLAAASIPPLSPAARAAHARLRAPASPRRRPATARQGELPWIFFFWARDEGQLPASVRFFPSPLSLFYFYFFFFSFSPWFSAFPGLNL